MLVALFNKLENPPAVVFATAYDEYAINAFDAQGVRVPPEYVEDGQISLNISATAVRGFSMDNDWIMFDARFGGKSFQVSVPTRNDLPPNVRLLHDLQPSVSDSRHPGMDRR